MPDPNPCLTCGACCASFRVSLYWAETDPVSGVGVPPELVEQVSPFLCAMIGTNSAQPRCVALQGVVGNQVSCLIYNFRPTACREFAISGQNNQSYDLCEQARKNWGLRPLVVPVSGKSHWHIKRKRRGVLRN